MSKDDGKVHITIGGMRSGKNDARKRRATKLLTSNGWIEQGGKWLDPNQDGPEGEHDLFAAEHIQLTRDKAAGKPVQEDTTDGTETEGSDGSGNG